MKHADDNAKNQHAIAEPTLGPAKYRKKPVVIEAWQLTESNGGQILQWINGNGGRAWNSYGHIFIHTLEGDHQASLGDYIIKGVAGEFYPCKPDIFAATYESERIAS